MQPELEAQRERLRRLRGRQEIKEKIHQDKQNAIERRFHNHERFIQDVMTIEPAPYLKLVAVLHRDSS